ncbi:ergothioneine biosynthesis protein EgtB [Thiohalobacter thiocyanaticus]|uniref:Ergothioneine biosynthesis protein EgtB n=1 Tax=Thiohalobacter thiocyanaticus TaxID=585455 RepID=A0A426QGC6_9GAMM|nr:ergothioneine biosynthesis protein EgtB [Thiohalobacter thiocyanaticus]RRQ20809.1 ergothioneine biosynthesis protein EgtB [Thiohalobacter thiocyanaticus]
MSQTLTQDRDTVSDISVLDREQAQRNYTAVRAVTEALCRPLSAEDCLLQGITETSPPKWHLAHVSWFFETFLLHEYLPGYRPFNPRFRYLFNSYYEQLDGFHPRARRGLLSRPSLEEVYRYRGWVDEHMQTLMADAAPEQWPQIALRLAIGLNHEQQHQELILTDLKHNFWVNPLLPVYREELPVPQGRAAPLHWQEYPGGVQEIGYGGSGYAFDNERPRHRAYNGPWRLASRLLTNGEYLAFMDGGGYTRPELWLSDGWATVQRLGWKAPLYWLRQDGDWWQYTLGGLRPLNPDEPVCHVSYYEADACARWAGRRLPTEQEWEVAAADRPVAGNLRDTGLLHPGVADGSGLQQLYGDVWEWTASPYTAYPGYRPPAGALGEYNGKFMCNQQVLRGGSCVTPADHIRASYRNFFYPHDRWQFMGLRLAEDAE